MSRRDHHRNRRQYSNNVVTSNCGDIRIRGSVQQVIEKYNILAAEDPVNRETYLQHAEHYTRLNAERTQHVF